MEGFTLATFVLSTDGRELPRGSVPDFKFPAVGQDSREMPALLVELDVLLKDRLYLSLVAPTQTEHQYMAGPRIAVVVRR